MSDSILTHPVLASAWIRVHNRDLLEEIENDLLFREARSDRVEFLARLLLRAGDFLISSGHRLKARYQTDSVSPAFRVS